jgi:cephalosporin hydroxylase
MRERVKHGLARAVRATGTRLEIPQPIEQTFPSPDLSTALVGYEQASDISDHLSAIFYFTAAAAPRLVVELGTRGGQSTRALVAAAALSGAQVLSIDIDDCSDVDVGGHRDAWTFVQADDVEFGREVFDRWCSERGLPPSIDVLFIDTSHMLEHTREELEVWLPHLSADATVLLHDTNMSSRVLRLDGSQGWSWDNNRGVVQALEERLGRRYDERTLFADVVSGYAVFHVPYCSGLTVLSRLPTDAEGPASLPT